MKNDTKQQLKDQVEAIAYDINNGTYEAEHYLEDALDINYVTNNKKEYKGARILISFGGPNIWIDTDRGVVEGFWGFESAVSEFKDNLDLDDLLEDYFDSL